MLIAERLKHTSLNKLKTSAAIMPRMFFVRLSLLPSPFPRLIYWWHDSRCSEKCCVWKGLCHVGIP